MLDMIADIGLRFAQPFVWVTVAVIGFCLINPKIFGKALLLVLFTMVYNTYLKSIWQVPLPAPLEGWAFPSGHMHSALVFWGWIAIEYRKTWLSAIVILMMMSLGFGLIHAGHHYPNDVLGAVGFGALSLLIYGLLQFIPPLREKPYRLGMLLIPLSIVCLFLMPEEARKPHVWQGLGGLVGFTLGWMCLASRKGAVKPSFIYKLFRMTITLFVTGLFFVFLGELPLPVDALAFVKTFIIGFWVPLSTVAISVQASSNPFLAQRA
jgi:hypothetical protein